MENQQSAGRYVSRIRNPCKRVYAEAYLSYLLGVFRSPPERPEGLSYMAAQAVRLTLTSYIPERSQA